MTKNFIKYYSQTSGKDLHYIELPGADDVGDPKYGLTKGFEYENLRDTFKCVGNINAAKEYLVRNILIHIIHLCSIDGIKNPMEYPYPFQTLYLPRVVGRSPEKCLMFDVNVKAKVVLDGIEEDYTSIFDVKLIFWYKSGDLEPIILLREEIDTDYIVDYDHDYCLGTGMFDDYYIDVEEQLTDL